MRCPSCRFENPEAMKFCGECGTPLKNRCPQCGSENPPQFKFCGQCATPLTEKQKAKGKKGSAESGVRSLESGPSLAVRATP